MISGEEKMLKERIQHVLKIKKVSIASIADSESERVMLGRQINGENTIVSLKTVHKLLYMFHDIDANWLILGEGSMTRTADQPRIYNHNEVHDSSAGGSINVGTSAIPVPVQLLIEEKDKRIAELERDKRQLQDVISFVTSQAQSLAPQPNKQ